MNRTMKIRFTVIIFFLPCLLVGTGQLSPSFSSEPKANTTESNQQAAKSADRPSHVKQAHKALKSMDQKIPAETSKAVRSMKEAFKKRFHTTQESKDRK